MPKRPPIVQKLIDHFKGLDNKKEEMGEARAVKSGKISSGGQQSLNPDEQISMTLRPDRERFFVSPYQAMDDIKTNGFDWHLVREYFKFTDSWLSEGEYSEMLGLALDSIEDRETKIVLLDMLDLQYTIFLAQVHLQEKILKQMFEKNSGKKEGRPYFVRGEGDVMYVGDEDISVANGERVIGYLFANEAARIRNSEDSKGAASSYSKIPPGSLAANLRHTYLSSIHELKKK